MSEVEAAYRLVAAGQPRRAAEELERAAAAGSADAALELAIWLLEGKLVRRDLAAARANFRRAGELGNAAGAHAYIAFLANGIGGVADWPEALRALRQLAGSDDRAATQVRLVEAMQLAPGGDPRAKPESRELSRSPEAWTFEALLTAAECSYLIEQARPLLQPSVIVDPATGRMSPHPIRTSHGASFPWVSEDLVISAINRRIASASDTDVRAGEPLQVLHYQPGQEYRPHLDGLAATDNQRVLTMLVYLNHGYEGGETVFTRTGVKFGGRVGDALLFRNAEPGGPPDEQAQHAGLPVTRGEKFLATRWIRERPFGPL